MGAPKRLHITTLGIYANERIDHVIMKRGADKVALVYTEKNRGQLDDIISRFSKFGMPIQPVEVDAWNFESTLASLLEIVSAHDEFNIEFNASCGTRIMTAATYMAAILTHSPVYIVTEDKDDIIELKPGTAQILTQPKLKILKNLSRLGGSVNSQKELGSRTDLNASSVSKHVKELASAGYIEKKQDGRKNIIQLTDLGRAILHTKEIRKERIWGD